MRNTILLAALLAVATASASLNFRSGTRYRLQCNSYPSGGVALGATHGSTALLYYDAAATTATSDAWWYVEPSGDGYTLRNAATGQYIYHEPTRESAVAKGLRLTETPADDSARWTFLPSEQGFVIACVAAPTQYFNVRLDGTYLVGTYVESGALSSNELFKIFDEWGNQVTETGNGDKPDYAEGSHGTDETGAYWELHGLQSPVVLTEDVSSPVYYTIRNLRQGNFVRLNNYELQQTDKPANATRFYFVQGGEAGEINIYGDNGQYVETYSYGSANSYIYANLGMTSHDANCWTTGFLQNVSVPGYTLRRVTDPAYNGRDYWNDFYGSGIGFFTADAGSTFVFASADERHVAHLAAQGINFAGTESAYQFRANIDSLRFDGKDVVYRTDTQEWMFNVRPKYMGGHTYKPKVEVRFRNADAGYELRLDDQPVAADGTFTIDSITGLKPYRLQICKNGNVTASTLLRFTFLPIVEINVPSCNSNTYTRGTIRVNFFQSEGYDSTYIAAFKYRGASALYYDKKSYAIKLYDSAGNSIDREFLGYREDNNWILDAMAIDKACMRNRVATDLWNDFAAKPYYADDEPKARTGTRGRFVEVLLNGRYHGLYCMTEKLDRKQMKLKKLKTAADGTVTQHGALYKGVDWTYHTFFGHESNVSYPVFPSSPAKAFANTQQESQNGFEIKYPKVDDGEPPYWRPLLDAINIVAASSDRLFSEALSEILDMPAITDYYLFLDLLLASDNHGKNMFYGLYDGNAATNKQKLTPAVWDLDGVFGLRWDGKETHTYATRDYPTYLNGYEHGQLSYYYRLVRNSYLTWNDDLRLRYSQLRQGEFEPEKLKERFRTYAERFRQSGADAREESKWPNLHNGIQADVDYICQWIDDRVAYLDQQYNYTPPIVVDAISHDVVAPRISVIGGKGCLVVSAEAKASLPVYSLSGQYLRTISADKGTSRHHGFAAGIYIAGGCKVIVR